MYYLLKAIFFPLSLLPLSVLHIISDGLYAIIYYVFGYRKKIALQNVQIAFPELSLAQQTRIVKDSYRNFTDTLVETIKLMRPNLKLVLERTTADFPIAQQMLVHGQPVHIMAGHQFNWEFGNLLGGYDLGYPFFAVYMPISNPALDKIFHELRSRFGTQLISATDFKNQRHRIGAGAYALALVADQNPGDPGNAYWMPFFGKPAPFVTGPSRGAVNENVAVIMIGVSKPKRGYYHFSAEVLAHQASDYTPQQLTQMYRTALEKVIRNNPSNYLWTHRRWKYDYNPAYGPLLD